MEDENLYLAAQALVERSRKFIDDFGASWWAYLHPPTTSESRPEVQTVKPKTPRVPKQAAVLRKWKAVWKLIKGQVKQGYTNIEIEDWLEKTQSNKSLRLSAETLADVIAAGEAGLLD